MHALIDALMVLVLHASRNYGAENGFKPGHNQAVQNLLDVSLQDSGLKADPHIKSNTWRANFCIMHDMILGSNTSGFGWDPGKCIFIAPEDVCDAYVKTRPEAAKFGDKSFPLYHKLSLVFGKDRATGSQATDLGDDEAVSEMQETAPIDLEDADIHTYVRPFPGDGKSNKRKRSKSDELLHMYSESCTTFSNTVCAMGNEMNMNLSKMIDLMKRVQIDALPRITFEEPTMFFKPLAPSKA